MLRSATPASLERLRRAATDVDRELDTALTCVGILPPLELQPIRACLLEPSTVLVAETNRDGHRLLSVRNRHGIVAWIHHDGRVVRLQPELATTVQPSQGARFGPPNARVGAGNGVLPDSSSCRTATS